ncbi:MAG: bifunctional nuclease family protein [Deltaproteobacteria bacterium]|nr:bifunctional nuclease family protein [Deltaproteobacteria bacterium]MCD6137977.1 bifunctional nuclease family protein [Deltaproteobacteria bacterium]RLB89853.1 MAG: bifunctional nuclease family protein [Deltaproteobacteria bacterium]RLB95657.1 MAG: bifunctional nuclease family protein [Deltaproteobacteria bacterium]RLC10355.1 MAG: bifunctional nuclease family protein [Deltaproteobacteria bacterium]
MLHEMKVSGIAIDPASNAPIVILKTIEGDQALPIWIGILEATAIATELENVRMARPMTHDLFKNFLDMLQIKISRVEVCDLKDNTFYARIFFSFDNQSYDIDARPSDAIALGLRADCPIFVEDKVFQKSRHLQEEPEAWDKSEEGKKMKEYLEKLRPEDFGKFKM